jgi:hypothetical protein
MFANHRRSDSPCRIWTCLKFAFFGRDPRSTIAHVRRAEAMGIAQPQVGAARDVRHQPRFRPLTMKKVRAL